MSTATQTKELLSGEISGWEMLLIREMAGNSQYDAGIVANDGRWLAWAFPAKRT